MASTKIPKDGAAQLQEQLLETLQNIFILQALNAGATGESVRSLLRVDKRRINKISKLTKRRKATA